MKKSTIAADEVSLDIGITTANIPSLLGVLVQMTGDMKWLEAPYAPRRSHGLDDNDSGGLPRDVQVEIRAAAKAAVIEWRAGRPLAIPEPSPALLARILSVLMAEEVPESYGDILAADMGLRETKRPTIAAPEGFRVIIIGAGVSGICAAINLRNAGIDCHVLEKNEDFGGTWWENRYPGAGVDTPNHIYTYSFAKNDWARYFALQGELLDYFRGVAERFGLRDVTSFGTRVSRVVWDEDAAKWSVTVVDAEGQESVQVANVVLSAVGILNTPLVPTIPGIETFPGPAVHTAQWPEDMDVSGKRVAVIGNGASGMQVVPAIADRVSHMTIFARSKQWAAPFPQFGKAVSDEIRDLLTNVPLYHQWYRARLMWTFNDRIHDALQKDPTWPEPARSLNATNDRHRRFFTNYVVSELGDRQDLLDKVLPTFPPYGKRILLDNGWYRTITRENVTLLPERLAEIRGSVLLGADGSQVEADVIVLATGFKAAEFLSSYDVVGRDGRKLRDFWEVDNARAYIGSTVPGFPNFFTLLGPNVGLGHGGSMIKAIELQTGYILSVIGKMLERDARTVEVRAELFEDYNRRIDEAHARMVWTHEGTDNWYRNSRGRVTAITPWRNDDFWKMTQDANPDDFIFGRGSVG